MCVRWYVAYPLSLRHVEEMLAERGIEVDHSTVHRWALKLLPVADKAFRRRKRPLGKSWRMDETIFARTSGAPHSWRAVVAGSSVRRRRVVALTPSFADAKRKDGKLNPRTLRRGRSDV
jgi:transposase-like protein